MQVAERGLLDLDTDVNRYLTGFQIPDIYPQPFDQACPELVEGLRTGLGTTQAQETPFRWERLSIDHGF